MFVGALGTSDRFLSTLRNCCAPRIWRPTEVALPVSVIDPVSPATYWSMAKSHARVNSG